MTPLELAKRYLAIVFSGTGLDRLGEILHPSCRFRGPLAQFDSAAAYLAALQADPPVGFAYRIIGEYESEHGACLTYEFSKPGVVTPMAQAFEVEGGKIVSILLVFDSAALQ